MYTALTARSVQVVRLDEFYLLPHEELHQIHLPHDGTTRTNDTPPTPNHLLAQTSPVVGICFCMIIVRLGSQIPEVREDSWESSQHTRNLSVSASRLSKVSVALDRVKVERDVYVSASESTFYTLNQTSPPEKQSTVH